MARSPGPHPAIGFALVAAMMLTGFGVVFQKTAAIQANEANVARTYEVLGEIENALATLLDAETGQRGYLLTGDAEYLEPYERATRRVDQQLEMLGWLTSDNPRQEARVNAIRVSARYKMNELARTISLAREQHLDAAQAIVRQGTGKALTETLKRLISEMRAEEISLLRARAVASASAYTSLVHTRIILTCLSLTFLFATYLAVSRHLSAQRLELSALRLQLEISATTRMDGDEAPSR
jgi:CHASE3 domain sensor protein